MKNGKYVSSSERAMNAVFIIIVVAVLALGVYAAGTKLYNLHQDSASETTETTTPSTVEELAEENGMTVDEFKAEYGLADDVTGDTALDEVYGTMTVANYAKLSGEDTETFLEENYLTGIVTGDATMDEAQEAYMQLPVSTIYSEDDLADAKSTYGITDDEMTDDMTLSEFNDLISEKYSEMLASEEDTTEEESAEDETATGEDISAGTVVDGAEVETVIEDAESAD